MCHMHKLRDGRSKHDYSFQVCSRKAINNHSHGSGVLLILDESLRIKYDIMLDQATKTMWYMCINLNFRRKTAQTLDQLAEDEST